MIVDEGRDRLVVVKESEEVSFVRDICSRAIDKELV